MITISISIRSDPRSKCQRRHGRYSGHETLVSHPTSNLNNSLRISPISLTIGRLRVPYGQSWAMGDLDRSWSSFPGWYLNWVEAIWRILAIQSRLPTANLVTPKKNPNTPGHLKDHSSLWANPTTPLHQGYTQMKYRVTPKNVPISHLVVELAYKWWRDFHKVEHFLGVTL